MSEILLELKNITMKFGGVTALNEVNLHVNKGEIAALIGPNGAGKTTVFNVVTGVYKPTSGEVNFVNQSIVGKKRYQVTKMGIAPHSKIFASSERALHSKTLLQEQTFTLSLVLLVRFSVHRDHVVKKRLR